MIHTKLITVVLVKLKLCLCRIYLVSKYQRQWKPKSFYVLLILDYLESWIKLKFYVIFLRKIAYLITSMNFITEGNFIHTRYWIICDMGSPSIPSPVYSGARPPGQPWTPYTVTRNRSTWFRIGTYFCAHDFILIHHMYQAKQTCGVAQLQNYLYETRVFIYQL